MIGTLIGAALSVGSSIYGGYKASEAAKEARENILQQQKDNQNWYERRYNEDATQRADAQHILQLTQQSIKDRNRAAQGRAAVTGSTNEAIAAEKAANNAALANAAATIAANGDRRKDIIEQQYRGQNDALQGQLNNIEMQRAQNIATAANGVADALGSAGTAVDDAGWFGKKNEKKSE